MMRAVSGYKSYYVSYGLVVIGVFLTFFVSGEATYANPSAFHSAIVARIMGPVAVMLGALGLSLRHAITKIERKVENILVLQINERIDDALSRPVE